MQESFLEELQNRVKHDKIHSKHEFMKLKVELARKYKLTNFPSVISILTSLPKEDREVFLKFLSIKPTRTVSGVAPVAIMTKPMACPPQAKCTFCPGGPKSVFGDVPKSYTGNEPASMRAARNVFSGYAQVMNRLEQYSLMNQSTEKIELIIMGGTFLYYPRAYQDQFVTESLQAMNDFSEMFWKGDELDFDAFKDFFELPSSVKDSDRAKKVLQKVLSSRKDSSLEREQKRNETAHTRCVALVVETRPDTCSESDIDQMLKLGTTRVELGIQSLSDDILLKVERGHSVQESIDATKMLKDSFLKACHQIMPGLYQSVDESVEMIKQLFEDPHFRPDALKVYPCLVMPGTKLYEEYKAGRFTPLSTEEAGEVLVRAAKYIPKYCRVMRIQRDIPTKVTIDGVSMTNFRQYVDELMKKNNVVSEDIHAREPRLRSVDWDHVELVRQDYKASDGDEIFLSFEDTKNNILLGFLRLRNPSAPYRKEIPPGTMGVRELHVYGTATGLAEQGDIQHRGLGKKLMLEAERISKEEFHAKKLVVISGIGVREYYKKLGYVQDGPYVSKNLR